uniref:C2H2-type domain-containing protein n=1 Tax=Oryzias latipes TaxID=8090 RepID=A0A3B3IJF6_ORYLA
QEDVGIMDTPSHPLHQTVEALTGSCSMRQLPQQCEKELLQVIPPHSHQTVQHRVTVTLHARVKRRARTFGYRRPPLEEAHGVSGKYSMDAGPTPHPSEHSYRDNPALAAPSPSGSHCSRSSFSLVRRMRTPWRPGVGEKRFSCTYCDKGFTRFSQLKEHLRCHTGEKPFSCTQCGRSFTKQCNLIRHAVVHSGEKPYQCSLCGKCFTQRSSLKSHQKTRIHTGEKPYTCDTCGKSFSQRSNLRTHQRTHKEELGFFFYVGVYFSKQMSEESKTAFPLRRAEQGIRRPGLPFTAHHE